MALAYYDGRRWLYTRPEVEVRDIVVDSEGEVWLATNMGVVRMHPQER